MSRPSSEDLLPAISDGACGIRLDGVARGHGQIWRQLVERKPADLARLAWLAVPCFAAQNAAEECGRHPVLAFIGQAVIGDAEEAVDDNFDAGFFTRFADRALSQRLQEIQLTS